MKVREKVRVLYGRNPRQAVDDVLFYRSIVAQIGNETLASGDPESKYILSLDQLKALLRLGSVGISGLEDLL